MKPIEEMPKWRQRAYKKWLKNRMTTEWSNNPIKRAKYCLHEWRWFMTQWNEKKQEPTYTFWPWTKHWILAYFGIVR